MIPRRIGIEQRISEEISGSQVLARFTGGVAPAQITRVSNPGGVAVVYVDSGQGIRVRTIFDDGSMSPTKGYAFYSSGNASCSRELNVLVFEQVSTPPPDFFVGGLIEAGVFPFGPVHPSPIILATGTHYPTYKGTPAWRDHVFGPTISWQYASNGKYLAMWHLGSECTSERSLSHTTLCGAMIDSNQSGEPVTETFDVVSDGEFHFNSGVQVFNALVRLRLDEQEFARMDAFGYAFVNSKWEIVVKVFDMAFGAFSKTSIYASRTFPGPGWEVAASSGDLPAVAWINRDTGDVMVSFSEMLPGEREMIFGDPIVVSAPLVWPRVGKRSALGNRRPALADVQGGVLIMWEAYEKDVGGRPTPNIKARLFHRSGAAMSDEFAVSSITSRNQVAPNVVATNRGFYAVWMDNSQEAEGGQTPDSDGWCVKGQEWTFDV